MENTHNKCVFAFIPHFCLRLYKTNETYHLLEQIYRIYEGAIAALGNVNKAQEYHGNFFKLEIDLSKATKSTLYCKDDEIKSIELDMFEWNEAKYFEICHFRLIM